MKDKPPKDTPIVASSGNGGNVWILEGANFQQPEIFILHIPKTAGLNKDYIVKQTKNGGLHTVEAL